MPPSDQTNTPAMRQWKRCKEAHPECILLFRMGDFYELFFDDAVRASKAIGLTLTERTSGVPMAGVPYHQLENYLRRLIGAGFRVAVADQLQDPKDAKGVVERGVTRVVSSGTLVDESLLDAGAPNRVAAVWIEPGSGRAGVASVEVSTGAFIVRTLSADGLGDELARLGAREVIFANVLDGRVPEVIDAAASALGAACTPRQPWQFREDEADEALRERFGVASLDAFSLSRGDPALPAAGALVRFLEETQLPDAESTRASDRARRVSLAHLSPPRREAPEGECVVDATSLRALEVERTIRGQGAEGSLVGLFSRDAAPRTAMGRRLLRDWLCRPLADRVRIEARHAIVATLIEDRRLAREIGEHLECVQDVARIGGRIALARATPRDLAALGASLDTLEPLAELCAGAPALAETASKLRALIASLAPLAARLGETCVEHPPAHLREGGLIRDGVDAALDRARSLQKDAGAWLAEYQGRIAGEIGLPQLRVGFNKVFGYYVELTAIQAREHDEKITRAGFVRKQTLKNAERYITDELKKFEDEVTTAEARAVEREQAIFDDLCDRARDVLAPIGAFADAIAELDALGAFSAKGEAERWVRPTMTDDPVLSIHAGRHPVLDEALGTSFVPNDTALGVRVNESGPGPSLALITGPNMAGKSTYIRQVALITLLAHAGCFVPADRATIGICDRIFTRVGADDALHRGQSTFMVEMTETAGILNHASARSLVILDEIGRGTSTLDGLALAWAIAEDLGALGEPCVKGKVEHDASVRAPRTLFATHYHELTELADRAPERVANLHVAVREWERPTDHGPRPEVVFLHRIEPGRADQSYGIHVAQLAGVPTAVIGRAREVLASLAVHSSAIDAGRVAPPTPAGGGASAGGQLPLFTEFVPHPAVDRLREIKLDGLTPLDAFDVLRELAGLAKDSG